MKACRFASSEASSPMEKYFAPFSDEMQSEKGAKRVYSEFNPVRFRQNPPFPTARGQTRPASGMM